MSVAIPAASLLARNKLTYLSLGHAARRGCDPASIHSICLALSQCTSLTTLELSFRFLSADFLRQIVAAASECVSLRTLRIIANGSLHVRQAKSLCLSLEKFSLPLGADNDEGPPSPQMVMMMFESSLSGAMGPTPIVGRLQGVQLDLEIDGMEDGAAVLLLAALGKGRRVVSLKWGGSYHGATVARLKARIAAIVHRNELTLRQFHELLRKRLLEHHRRRRSAEGASGSPQAQQQRGRRVASRALRPAVPTPPSTAKIFHRPTPTLRSPRQVVVVHPQHHHHPNPSSQQQLVAPLYRFTPVTRQPHEETEVSSCSCSSSSQRPQQQFHYIQKKGGEETHFPWDQFDDMDANTMDRMGITPHTEQGIAADSLRFIGQTHEREGDEDRTDSERSASIATGTSRKEFASMAPFAMLPFPNPVAFASLPSPDVCRPQSMVRLETNGGGCNGSNEMAAVGLTPFRRSRLRTGAAPSSRSRSNSRRGGSSSPRVLRDDDADVIASLQVIGRNVLSSQSSHSARSVSGPAVHDEGAAGAQSWPPSPIPPRAMEPCDSPQQHRPQDLTNEEFQAWLASMRYFGVQRYNNSPPPLSPRAHHQVSPSSPPIRRPAAAPEEPFHRAQVEFVEVLQKAVESTSDIEAAAHGVLSAVAKFRESIHLYAAGAAAPPSHCRCAFAAAPRPQQPFLLKSSDPLRCTPRPATRLYSPSPESG